MKFWAAILAFFSAIGVWLKIGNDAKTRERLKGKVADYENAEDIRDRVRDADDRLRDHDGDGWRD